MSDPTEKILEALRRHRCHPRPSPNGWIAHCPAHDDRNPSLSIGVGQEGQTLIRCFAGCSPTAVLDALRLTWADLWPDTNRPHGNGKKTAPNPDKAYPTAREALAAYGLGKPARWWAYEDADGQPVMVVARWDGPDGKEIRPVSKTASGWKIGALPPPRPVYNLPAISKASPDEPIVVVEGEKAADAAAQLGFVATTSSGGANAASKSDWTPLAGRDVWVIPDNDEAGLRYAGDVVRLAYQAGAKGVRVLKWDKLRPQDYEQLPAGFDVADWYEQLARQDPDKGAQALAAHIKAITAVVAPEPRPQSPDMSEADDDEEESPSSCWPAVPTFGERNGSWPPRVPGSESPNPICIRGSPLRA